jgi:hypothetical protein
MAAFFTSQERRVFDVSEFREMLIAHGEQWNLPRSLTWPKLIKRLMSTNKFTEIRLNSTTYRPIVRYVWGTEVSPVRLALSTARNTYLTHASAMWVHGVGGLANDLIVNHEQSPKASSEGDFNSSSYR